MMQAMQRIAHRATAQLCRCPHGNLYLPAAPQGWGRGALHVLSAAPDLTSSSKPPRRRPKPSSDAGPRQVSTSTGKAAPRDKTADGAAKPGGSSAGKQRLSKVLAASGVAARRASEELMAKGVVTVNGQVVLTQVLVDPESDVIHVDGKKIDTSSAGKNLHYFAINKPKGYICSSVEAADRQEGKRVVDLLQPWLDVWARQPDSKGQLPPRFFTVGRLDVATTGLIFVTNDGHWANRVIHPSADLTKEYLMLVDKAPSKVQLEQMMRGVVIDGVLVQPEEVATLEESVRLRVVVKEGKKHEGNDGRGGHTISSYASNTSGSIGSNAGNINGSISSSASSGSNMSSGSHSSGQTASERMVPPDPIIPRYDSSRLMVTLDGATMWVWDVAAWRLSLALAARDNQPNQPTAVLTDTLTEQSWQDGGWRLRRKGRYRSGASHRSPVARRWREQPLRVITPSAPNLRTPLQWAALARARAAAVAAAGAGGVAAVGPSGGAAAGGLLAGVQQAAGVGLGAHKQRQWSRAQGVPSEEGQPMAQSGAGQRGEEEPAEPLPQGQQQRQQQQERWQAGGQAARGRASGQDLVCREEVDWKVRVLASSAGLEVLSLKRVRVGGYRLPRTLRLGEYMSLGPTQLKRVTDVRAQEAASSKQPSEQKTAPKMSLTTKGGIPNAEAIAALLEPGGQEGPVAAALRGNVARKPRTNNNSRQRDEY